MNTYNVFARIGALLFALMFSISANAIITLTPDGADVTIDPGGQGTLSAEEVAALFDTSDLSLLYKAEAGGSDEGPFANDYMTLFSGDPNDALITWGLLGDSITCPECYLVVKDGSPQPKYLFDLGSWDGMESLSLEGFYPGNGAISHVAIFGNPTVQVPEPGTLALLGLGLIGLTLTQKKRSAR